MPNILTQAMMDGLAAGAANDGVWDENYPGGPGHPLPRPGEPGYVPPGGNSEGSPYDPVPTPTPPDSESPPDGSPDDPLTVECPEKDTTPTALPGTAPVVITNNLYLPYGDPDAVALAVVNAQMMASAVAQ